MLHAELVKMHENYALHFFPSSHKFIFHSLFDDFSRLPRPRMDSSSREKKRRKEGWNGRKWFLFRRRRRDANAWDANGERKRLAHGSRAPLFPDSHVSAPPTLHLLIRGTVRLFLKRGEPSLARIRYTYRALFSTFCVFCFDNLL